MKLAETTVRFVHFKVDKQHRPFKVRKKLLAKHCSLCSSEWVYDNENKLKVFLKKIFNPSSRYCSCESNKNNYK